MADDLLTAEQVSSRLLSDYGIRRTARWVQQQRYAGHIPEARRFGAMWLYPEAALPKIATLISVPGPKRRNALP